MRTCPGTLAILALCAHGVRVATVTGTINGASDSYFTIQTYEAGVTFASNRMACRHAKTVVRTGRTFGAEGDLAVRARPTAPAQALAVNRTITIFTTFTVAIRRCRAVFI